MAQKLGVIQQTVNTWISDIRGRQRGKRNIIIARLNRLACPPSFWRGWTQGQIAKVVGLDRMAVSRIVQNTKISEMHNLLSQGRDMDYIAWHYNIDVALTWALRLEGKSDQEHFEYLKFFRELLPPF